MTLQNVILKHMKLLMFLHVIIINMAKLQNFIMGYKFHLSGFSMTKFIDVL